MAAGHDANAESAPRVPSIRERFPFWEIHPALVHFPIAFFLGAVLLDLFAAFRKDHGLARAATALMLAGLAASVLAVAAGVLAFLTVLAHTEGAHEAMYWHVGLIVPSLVLFAWVGSRRRSLTSEPGKGLRAAGVVANALLVTGAALGGWIVYHGGAGVAPELLAPAIRHGHSHGTAGEPHESAPTGPGRPAESDQPQHGQGEHHPGH